VRVGEGMEGGALLIGLKPQESCGGHSRPSIFVSLIGLVVISKFTPGRVLSWVGSVGLAGEKIGEVWNDSHPI
jgi:hypothetical protein